VYYYPLQPPPPPPSSSSSSSSPPLQLKATDKVITWMILEVVMFPQSVSLLVEGVE